MNTGHLWELKIVPAEHDLVSLLLISFNSDKGSVVSPAVGIDCKNGNNSSYVSVLESFKMLKILTLHFFVYNLKVLKYTTVNPSSVEA